MSLIMNVVSGAEFIQQNYNIWKSYMNLKKIMWTIFLTLFDVSLFAEQGGSSVDEALF